MTRLTKTLAVMAAGLLIAGCVSRADYRNLEDKYNTDVTGMSAHMRDLEAANDTVNQDNQKLTLSVKALQLEVDKLNGILEVYKDELKVTQENIIRKLKDLSLEGDMNIEDNKPTILGDVLFDPGRADLKEKGKEVLKKIAGVIKSEPGYMVQIVGHTDTDQIDQSAGMWKTHSNFELGAHRALNVLLFMEEQGVDPARMYLSSYGEYQPKGADKAKNRRIEISFTKLSGEKKEIAPKEETPPPEKEKEQEKEPSK